MATIQEWFAMTEKEIADLAARIEVLEAAKTIALKDIPALAVRLAAVEEMQGRIRLYLNDTVNKHNALAERVLALERVHVPPSSGREWIKGNGLLPDDAYDCTNERRTEAC